MKANLLQFSAKPQSRHPKHFPLAYNKVTHKYSSKYVNPEKWGIEITHALLKEKTDTQAEAAKINPNPNKPTYEKLMAEKAALQDRVREIDALLRDHEIRFNVKNADGSFSKDTAINDYTPVVEVPKMDTYSITIKVKNKNGQTTTASSNLAFRDILIVSMGDSYAAGEGNPDKNGEPDGAESIYAQMGALAKMINMKLDMKEVTSRIPNVTPNVNFAEWQEPLAHRSYRSGHALSVEKVEGKYKNTHLVTTFLPLARSGAKTEEGLLKPNLAKYHNERQLKLTTFPPYRKVTEQDRRGSLDFALELGQIDEAKNTLKNKEIDFLILTIGGNDIKWTSNFPLLIMRDFEFMDVFPATLSESTDEEGRKILEDRTMDLLKLLPEKFKKLNSKIKETLRPKFVLLTEYPSGFFGATDNAGNEILKTGCDVFRTPIDLDIDQKDAALVKKLADLLNKHLKKAAEDNHWIWVDGIAAEFAKHGCCDENTCFVSTTHSFKSQGDWYGMLHPNAKGHSVYAKHIAEKIKETIAANITMFA